MTKVNYKPKNLKKIKRICELMYPNEDQIDGKRMRQSEVAEASLLFLAQWFNEHHLDDVSPELHNAIEDLFDKLGWLKEETAQCGEKYKTLMLKYCTYN